MASLPNHLRSLAPDRRPPSPIKRPTIEMLSSSNDRLTEIAKRCNYAPKIDGLNASPVEQFHAFKSINITLASRFGRRIRIVISGEFVG